jgi:hypothetical protein
VQQQQRWACAADDTVDLGAARRHALGAKAREQFGIRRVRLRRGCIRVRCDGRGRGQRGGIYE